MVTFRVGEIALLIRCEAAPLSKGKEVEITAGLHPVNDRLCYTIEADHLPQDHSWVAPPQCLRKIPPKEQLGSWDVGVWVPDALRHKEDLWKPAEVVTIEMDSAMGKPDDA